MRSGYGVAGGEQDSSACCEIPKDSIKSYVIKERERETLSLSVNDVENN